MMNEQDYRDHPGRYGGVLSVDLDALVANWRLLRQRGTDAMGCGACVKADAYGLGAAQICPALWRAGCREFFVATLEEGLALREIVPDANVHVFYGVTPDCANEFIKSGLIPVHNTLDQIDIWSHHAGRLGQPLPCDIQVDTGLNRLGLSMLDAELLNDDNGRLKGLDVGYVISHLACADDIDSPMNNEQLQRFRRVRRLLPMGKASFANSSGIFLGADYHFDLLRPGAAIYGINPRPEMPNPMAQVVRVQSRVIQIRDVEPGQSIGYGAAHVVETPTRAAIVGTGYADGMLRALSGRGRAYLGDRPLTFLGRVSMDLIALDVTGLAPDQCRAGSLVDMIGPHNPPDLVADAADTIGYEILTALGSRYRRVHVGGTAFDP